MGCWTRSRARWDAFSGAQTDFAFSSALSALSALCQRYQRPSIPSRRSGAPSLLMRILLVNWQDLDNPQAGAAEIHMHEIFGRLAAAGHEVTLLCGGWPGSPPRARIDDIEVHRVGTRHTFPFLARS